MARTCVDRPIHTISGRRNLPPQVAPFWRAIRQGLRVGYRRHPNQAAGTWLCRIALPSNDIRQHVIGPADDHPARADGETIFSYGQAVDAAQRWAAAEAVIAKGATRRAKTPTVQPTVADALAAYRSTKRDRGQESRAREVETVLRKHLPPQLAAAPVSELTAPVLNRWLAGLTPIAQPTPLTQGSLDKLRGILKAALRQAGAPISATTNGLSAAAVPNRQTSATRVVELTGPQVQGLIAAAYVIDINLGFLVEAAAVTGSRPSQLLKCTRQHLDTVNGTLSIPPSAKGKAGIRKTRPSVPFPVSPDFARRLGAQADPAPGAALLQATRHVRVPSDPPGGLPCWQADGRTEWTRDRWAELMTRVVDATPGVPPETSLYHLRHARVASLIRAGMSLREIAGLLDTSVAMLERSYSANIGADAQTLSRLRLALALELRRDRPRISRRDALACTAATTLTRPVGDAGEPDPIDAPCMPQDGPRAFTHQVSRATRRSVLEGDLLVLVRRTFTLIHTLYAAGFEPISHPLLEALEAAHTACLDYEDTPARRAALLDAARGVTALTT